MGAALREVIFDCNNPRRVAEFWGAVLGWDVQEKGDAFWMSESDAPFPNMLLIFVPVPEGNIREVRAGSASPSAISL
jgi:hypothetical protein